MYAKWAVNWIVLISFYYGEGWKLKGSHRCIQHEEWRRKLTFSVVGSDMHDWIGRRLIKYAMHSSLDSEIGCFYSVPNRSSTAN